MAWEIPKDVFPVAEVKVRPAGAATDELHKTIREQIAAMDRQSIVLRRYTRITIFLAAVQTIAALVAIAPFVERLKEFLIGLVQFVPGLR